MSVQDIDQFLLCSRRKSAVSVCTTNISTPVKTAANSFINSPQGFLVVVDDNTGASVGILTLHDLLRAQAAVAE